MFKCDKCGMCCRSLACSSIYRDLDRGDGVCRYLVDNLCSIYEDRPLKCRIDACYTAYFKHHMTLEEYYSENYKVCNLLKTRSN